MAAGLALGVALDLGRLAVALALPPALGMVLLRAVAGPAALSRWERGALAWALGWGAVTLAMPLPVVLGVARPWSPPVLLALWAALAVPAALAARRQGRPARMAPADEGAARPVGRGWTWIGWAAALLVAAQGLAVVLHALAWPVHDLDAWSIWAYKARMFYLSGGIPPAYFHDASRLFTHPDYPLLVPLAETWLYGWLGQPDDWLVMALFPPFAAGVVAATAGALARMGRAAGLAGAVVLVCVPYLLERAAAGDADVPLALFAAASTACLWRWLHDDGPARGRLLALSGLLAGLGAWTKKEGAVVLALQGLVVALACWRRARRAPRRAAGQVALFVGPALVAAGPWVVFLALRRPLTRDFLPVNAATLAAHVDRLPTIALFMVLRLLDVRRWNAVWLLLAGVVVLGRRRLRRDGAAAYLLLLLALQLGADGALFVFSDWQPYTAHLQTALDRLLLHALPLAVLLLVVLGTARADGA